MYDLESEEYFVSRNVRFVENVFPFIDVCEISEKQIHGWGWPLDSSDENDEGNETQNVVSSGDLRGPTVPLANDIAKNGGLEEAQVKSGVDQAMNVDRQQSIHVILLHTLLIVTSFLCNTVGFW